MLPIHGARMTPMCPKVVCMSSVLNLENVSLWRGRKYLLKDVNWQVKDDQRWVVLGPNGAGKTTLMKIAATQLFPSAGTVDILGERLGRVNVADLRPSIGLASNSVAAMVREREQALDLVVSAAYGMTGRWSEHYDKEDERRAFQLLQEWGAGTLMSRRFATLSGGEKARVLIARALMTDPELMLLDEPGNGLDLGGREDLVSRLAEFARSPYAPALILVTHHLEEIPPGFTHVLMLKDGEVTAKGPLDETLTEENLKRTFGVDVTLTRTEQGRFSAFAR